MSIVFDCNDPQSRSAGIRAAVGAAKAGRLVVVPTDTLYGVGCDAFDSDAVGSLLAARTGEAYQKPDDFFGGQTVWQNFADWLVQVPAVNYGIFTNELDTAVAANFPALVKGTPVDEVLKAIEDQAAGQIQ